MFSRQMFSTASPGSRTARQLHTDRQITEACFPTDVQVPTSPILGEGGRPIGSHSFSAIGSGSRHEGFATDRYNSADIGAAAPGQQGGSLTLHVLHGLLLCCSPLISSGPPQFLPCNSGLQC